MDIDPTINPQINTTVGIKKIPQKNQDSTEYPQEKKQLKTSDYRLDKIGRKIKAHTLKFSKGEDDGQKGVTEQMKKNYTQFVHEHTLDLIEDQKNELVAELQEVLSKDAAAGEWIHDFVHSDDPKFKGKSKEKRKQMALAAYYAKQRNEALEIEEQLKGGQVKLDKNKNGKLDAEDFKKLRKEESEQLEEDFEIVLEAFDADDYEASHEKSKFKDGYRAVLKHKKTGREVYVGGTAYKSKEHAEGEAETYKKHYSVGSGKMTPGANMRHDRAVAEYRKKAQAAGHIAEGWDDMLAASKARAAASKKTTTSTAHDVKHTSTGAVYTKQRDADGMSKEFKRDNEPAQKRGRGRPKKSSFGEAVEFLMALDEEMFDSMMEEGFDAFMEHFEQLDEVSKATLGSYVKKAVSGMSGVAVNAHMAGGQKPGSPEIKKHLEKARKRIAGIEKATDRLTK